VVLDTEAIRDGVDDLKAIMSAIARTWIGAEDDRQNGRKTPGPPIGSRPWADFMIHYLRQAHAELHETEPAGGINPPQA
jgi:membrane carboxypeptidase/penicillin-binding protein